MQDNPLQHQLLSARPEAFRQAYVTAQGIIVYPSSPKVINIGYQEARRESVASKGSFSFQKALTHQRVKDNTRLRQHFAESLTTRHSRQPLHDAKSRYAETSQGNARHLAQIGQDRVIFS